MKKFKVLAADDDVVARGLLEEVLVDDLQLEARIAQDGEEAWSVLNAGTFEPDFCVFDMMMPKLNGLDLLKRLRSNERFAKLPVILCTAVGDDEALEMAASLNVLAYIMKPYQTTSLARELNELMQEIGK